MDTVNMKISEAEAHMMLNLLNDYFELLVHQGNKWPEFCDDLEKKLVIVCEIFRCRRSNL